MAEKLQTVFHYFDFIEENRVELTFSGPSRLDSVEDFGCIKLHFSDEANGFYPTTGTEAIVRTRVFSPSSVRAWQGFQALTDNDHEGLTATAFVKYRLCDGTNQFYWNGAAWVVDTTHWNTEAEVSTHIASFPATARQLQFVILLGTTNKRHTPRVTRLKLAFKAKIHFVEDLLLRSLVPALRSLQFLVDFAVVQAATGTSINLGTAVDKNGTPFNIQGIDSAYNHTADPDHLNNIFTSYNPTTRVITLASSVPAGAKVFVVVSVSPVVVLDYTNTDFIELEKTPALIIRDVKEANSAPLSSDDGVINRATGDAIRLPAPYRGDLEFSMIIQTSSSTDLLRAAEAVKEYAENNKFIRSVGLDRVYRFWLEGEFSGDSPPADNDMHSTSMTACIKDFLAYKRAAVLEKAVMAVNLNAQTII